MSTKCFETFLHTDNLYLESLDPLQQSRLAYQHPLGYIRANIANNKEQIEIKILPWQYSRRV
jgi:hypothetical protein